MLPPMSVPHELGEQTVEVVHAAFAGGRVTAAVVEARSHAALDRFVKIRFQAEDPEAEPAASVMRRFSSVGLPTYVILKPR